MCHARLSDDEERIIEQAPGSRTLLIGGERSKHEAVLQAVLSSGAAKPEAHPPGRAKLATP